MKQFRKKTLSLKLYCTCVNDDYFDIHLLNYYDFLGFKLAESKVHGVYSKAFYRLKNFTDIKALGLDENFYFNELPPYICVSNIYKY